MLSLARYAFPGWTFIAELEEAEESAKAMAEGANVEVETTGQDKETEEENKENEE